MKYFVILLLFITGCQTTTYEHNRDGIKLSTTEFLVFDTKNELSVLLPDNARLGLGFTETYPDPNSVETLASLARTLEKLSGYLP